MILALFKEIFCSADNHVECIPGKLDTKTCVGFSRSTCCIHLFHVGSRTAFLSCHFEVPGWTKVLALDEQRDIPKLGALLSCVFYEHLLELSFTAAECVTVRDVRSAQSVQPDVMTYLCRTPLCLRLKGLRKCTQMQW